jgi:hypothetical protein
MMGKSQQQGHLYRYFNGRLVSLDVDKLLPAFDPFHSGIIDDKGTVPLRFPGFENNYDLRLGADAVARRVTFGLTIRLPIDAPGFWFCIYCLMREDFLVLVVPMENGFLYANRSTPAHVPKGESDFSFSSFLTYVDSASELVSMFTNQQPGG